MPKIKSITEKGVAGVIIDLYLIVYYRMRIQIILFG